MFAKFACAVALGGALVASTGAAAGSKIMTLDELLALPPKPAGAPAKSQPQTFVDEMTPGNWDEAAMARYRSWTLGLADLFIKNCQSSVVYKVDEDMCEVAALMVKNIADMSTLANYWSSPGGRKTWAAKGGK